MFSKCKITKKNKVKSVKIVKMRQQIGKQKNCVVTFFSKKGDTYERK